MQAKNLVNNRVININLLGMGYTTELNKWFIYIFSLFFFSLKRDQNCSKNIHVTPHLANIKMNLQ